MLSHYEILQVSPMACPEVIEAAYWARKRQVTKRGDLLKQTELARQVLMNEDLRATYDAERALKSSNIVGDRYRIVSQIAQGDFGTTYKAERIDLPGCLVCIKHARRISPEAEATLSREAQAMWNLRHHGIPPIRDYLHLQDGSVALVMGFIDGDNLHDLVMQNGPLVPEAAAWIAERILNALKYLHLYGVIHGDLQPKNVIIEPDSHAVSLVDFGVASLRPTKHDISTGYTPLFGPPEAKKGLPPLPESDFFSLGATMLFALTGDLDVVKSRTVPNNIDEPLRVFIQRLLTSSPLQRPSWEDEDLVDTLGEIRLEAFGRRTSDMMPLTYTHDSK